MVLKPFAVYKRCNIAQYTTSSILQYTICKLDKVKRQKIFKILVDVRPWVAKSFKPLERSSASKRLLKQNNKKAAI